MSSSQLSVLKIALVFSSGLIASVSSRLVFGKELQFDSTGRGFWWLGGLLLCSWILVGLFVARLGWLGWTVDQDLRELAERDVIHSFLDALHYGRDPRDYFALLPAEFIESSGVAEVIASGDRDTRLQTLPAWLKVVHGRMSRKEYWHDEELQKLVLLGEILYRRRSMGSQGLEARIATDLVLLENRYFWLDSSIDHLTEHETDADFFKLVDLVLTRTDLHLAPALDIPTTSRTFADRYYKLHPRPESHQKPLHFFAALEARKQLNLEWRRFKSGLPYPSRPPFSREETIKVDALHSLLLMQQDNRASMAALLLYLELKGLRRNGQALPRTWEDFRPEVEKIGRAYPSWIVVDFENEGVRVNLCRPPQTNPYVLWVPRKSGP